MFELWPQRLQERHHCGRAPHGSVARTTSPSVGPGRTKQPTPKRSSMIAWSSARSPAPRTTAPVGTGSPPKRASTAPASSHERAGSTGSTSCRYARRTAGSSRLRRPSRGCARHTPSRDRSRGRGRPWRPSPGDRPPRHEGGGDFVDVRDAGRADRMTFGDQAARHIDRRAAVAERCTGVDEVTGPSGLTQPRLS